MKSYKDEVDALLDAFGQSQDLEALRAGLHAIGEPRLPPLPRFDGEELAERLDPDEEVPLLIAICEWAYADLVVRASDDLGLHRTPAVRACEAAWTLLLEDVREILGPRLTIDLDDVRVPKTLGRVCARCGCSNRDACHPPCSWADSDLCTSCATKGD